MRIPTEHEFVAFLVYTQLSVCLSNTRSSINAYIQEENLGVREDGRKEEREQRKRKQGRKFLLTLIFYASNSKSEFSMPLLSSLSLLAIYRKAAFNLGNSEGN